MNIPIIVQAFLDTMQQLQPGIAATLTAGSAIKTVGTIVVTVLQKGKQLVTYLVRKRDAQKSALTADGQSRLVSVAGDEPIATKNDVAVVVDISRRSLRDVERYLVTHSLDADLIIITNDPKYGPQPKPLDEDNPQAWLEIVQEFNVGINAIKHQLGAVHLHIFLAVPVALAFGLGAVLGTVDRATVYHWNQSEYRRVLETTRNIRFG